MILDDNLLIYSQFVFYCAVSCTWIHAHNIIENYCTIFGYANKSHCQATKFILSLYIKTTIARYIGIEVIHDHFVILTISTHQCYSMAIRLHTYPKQKKYFMSNVRNRKASLVSPKSAELPSDTPV